MNDGTEASSFRDAAKGKPAYGEGITRWPRRSAAHRRQYRQPAGLPQRKAAHGQNALVSHLLPQLPRHSLGPIASGQHPSVVTKHDQPTRILLDAGSVD